MQVTLKTPKIKATRYLFLYQPYD